MAEDPLQLGFIAIKKPANMQAILSSYNPSAGHRAGRRSIFDWKFS